ncbi:MAG: barstar family protein [Gammaproteobacteria bacterium]|nr:barstar family protein [Gammaproteobacteria bacterium]
MYLVDLKKATAVSIHFARPEEISSDVAAPGFAVLEGSLAGINGEEDVLAVVASAMKFPAYFGSNWDALDECLGDMDWLPADGYVLVLHDSEAGWSRNPYALGRLLTAWLEASEYWAEAKVPFHLIFVM